MKIPEAAKAYLAAVAALATFLMGVLDPTARGLAAFASITTVQWLGALVSVLAAFGIVYAVPNRPAPPLEVTIVEPQLEVVEGESSNHPVHLT